MIDTSAVTKRHLKLSFFFPISYLQYRQPQYAVFYPAVQQSQQAGQLVSQGQAQIPQQPQMSSAHAMPYVRRPRSNPLKIVNPDSMEEINAAGAVSVVSNHLFDGLELSKHLKSLFSKQGIEDCFLFFSYSIGLMCRFVAFMLLKYQVCPSQTSKVMIQLFKLGAQNVK